MHIIIIMNIVMSDIIIGAWMGGLEMGCEWLAGLVYKISEK